MATEDDSTVVASRWGGIIELQPQQLIRVAILGLVTGIVAWLVTLFMQDVVLSALSCGEATGVTCEEMTADLASIIGTVVAGVVGLLGLVKLGVYRPIIVVVAALICLWQLAVWTDGLQWYEAIAWYGALYAILYVLFAWLVRPRSLVIVLLAVIPTVVLIRLLSVL